MNGQVRLTVAEQRRDDRLPEHCDADTEQPAKAGQHETLGQKLPNHASPCGAEAHADGDFVRARGGSRQEQVRNVRAGEQQNQTREDHQEQEGRRVTAPQAVEASSAVDEGQRRRLVPASSGVPHMLRELLKRRRQRRLRALQTHGWLEAAHDLEPALARIVEALEERIAGRASFHDERRVQRHVHIGRQSGIGAEEPARRDADDGERRVVEQDGLAHRGIGTAEPLVRQRGRHHHNRRRALAVVVGDEQPAGGRDDAETSKVAAGDVFAFRRRRLVLDGQTEPSRALIREHAREDVIALLEQREAGVREDVAGIAGGIPERAVVKREAVVLAFRSTQVMRTSACGSLTGSARTRMASVKLYSRVFAPMPSPRHSTAVVVKARLFVSVRTA